MPTSAVRSFIESNPTLTFGAPGKWQGPMFPDVAPMYKYPLRGIDPVWCRHIFDIGDWYLRVDQHAYFQALALPFVLSRRDPVIISFGILSRVMRFSYGWNVRTIVELHAASLATTSDTMEREGNEQDVTPVAFTDMKLSDDEAASLDAWFERAVSHPADSRDVLPRRGEIDPGERER